MISTLRPYRWLIVVIATLAIGLVSFAPASSGGAAGGASRASGSIGMWDLASDFGITATNPQPDSYGNPNVWSWMRGTQLAQPSTFTLLNTYTTSAFGVAGLDQFTGDSCRRSPLPNDCLPAVGINATGQPLVPVNLPGFWPKNAIRVHPSVHSDAIVVWRSPVTGVVRVNVYVWKMVNVLRCGNGISWRLSLNGTSLGNGSISNIGSPEVAFQRVSVVPGTLIYLAVGPELVKENACDSTGVGLTITLGQP
jgi:hypothetical protein